MNEKLLEVKEGRYKIISSYYNRIFFLKIARQALLKSIFKISGKSVAKNVVAFLRKTLDKKRVFDQKFAVIDFKVGIS